MSALPSPTGSRIETVEQLRTIVGEPLPRVRDKVRTTLHELDRKWLAASPFVLIATSDAEGRCDVSPKGDPSGIALVVDEVTLAVPERPGNRRVDGFLNVLQNPQVGLLFVIPGRPDTLRVNGRAHLVDDAPWFDDQVVAGHRPLLAMVVEIEEVFAHCAKAFMRSRIWDPRSWENESAAAVPSRPEIARALERPEDSLEALQEYYGPAYAQNLY